MHDNVSVYVVFWNGKCCGRREKRAVWKGMVMGGGGQDSSGYIYVLGSWGHIIEVTPEPRLGVKSWPYANLGEKMFPAKAAASAKSRKRKDLGAGECSTHPGVPWNHGKNAGFKKKSFYLDLPSSSRHVQHVNS